MGVVSEPAGGAAATASAVKKDNGTDVEAAGHVAPAQTLGQDGRPASVSECQLNLLGHVESVHRQISGRMDLIERELDGKHTAARSPMLSSITTRIKATIRGEKLNPGLLPHRVSQETSVNNKVQHYVCVWKPE